MVTQRQRYKFAPVSSFGIIQKASKCTGTGLFGRNQNWKHPWTFQCRYSVVNKTRGPISESLSYNVCVSAECKRYPTALR